MNKRPALVIQALLAISLLLFSCQVEKTTPVIEKHLSKYPDVRKSYIYQSVLRLANIKKDPDFNKLIEDVRKITIYLPPREDSTYQVKELRSSLSPAGYEELIDMRTANAERISLWVNESGSRPHYVGMLDAAAEDYIFEIEGEINLEYLSSLSSADEGSLRDLLK
jgi:hypothetical protein